MTHKINLTELNWRFPLISEKQHIADIDSETLLAPFAQQLLDTLSELGRYLIRNSEKDANIVALGFWLRKSNLARIAKQYAGQERTAKGIVFHIAPGNVDTLFFYSLVVALFAGNISILRLSSQTSVIADKLIYLLNQFVGSNNAFYFLQDYIKIVQYQKNDQVTQQLSKLADARVIWGSNNTISSISAIPAKADAVDVCFPDRYSVAVIQLETTQQVIEAVNGLLSDTKAFYQQACSSPKVIYWLNTAQNLQQQFWEMLSAKLLAISDEMPLNESEYIAKTLYWQQVGILSERPVAAEVKNQMLTLIAVEEISREIVDAHCGIWCFLDMQLMSIAQLDVLEHCQTIACFGVDENVLNSKVANTEITAKRVVSLGQSLVFSHIWDGIDLIDMLTIREK
ncbi:acyl-CoA reductase [Thalassotalea sp. G2M2-11]|uniref:acyl-CoA reductase n=1 Tax=Thalassotalea sp. G2M2-11 TaxID=2787627 RepID=UPI0019D04394